MSSTDPLFFDTDCLSAFLWIHEESILAKLYPGRVVIAEQVYAELSNPCVSHLKARVNLLIGKHQARRESISTGTDVYALYYKLAYSPDKGHAVIGKGEAAAIALAKEKNGILASNNLMDISVYVKEYGLTNMTTGDILKEALQRSFITEAEGNALWCNMLKRRRKLGYDSFTNFLKAHP